MFVPDWSSFGEDTQQESNNSESNTQPSINDESSMDRNSSNISSGMDDVSIELTHDEATGITTVTSDEEEDGMNQCAMWAASSANQDLDNNISTSAISDTNNVLNSFGGGDIWSTEGFSFESPLKDLLDTNIYSLVDLLEQDELLQELRGCEARLIDYFSKPAVVAGLVECMICEVPYAGQPGGKERWCREERERREGIAAEPSLKETNLTREEGNKNEHVSTILDTTNEIEAYWNSPVKNPQLSSLKNKSAAENQRTPEEEYDLRYFRYPYMACEVLCSDVGDTLDVLINGSVLDITIDDDDDSLLNDSTGVGIQETKLKDEEPYDNIDVFLDDPSSNILHDQNAQQFQELQPPLTPRNRQAPSTRILDLLFSVLIDTPPSSLDDRRAGYLEKILVILFRKYSDAMSDYMNTPLIDTVRSKEISHQVSKVSMNNIDCDGESVYFSLMPNMDSYQDEDSESMPALLKPVPGPIKTELSPIGVSSIHAPPMLMCALFDHLHSHSIMHIVQRLLLPSSARKQQKSDTSRTNVQPGDRNGATNDKFMSAISEMNSVEDRNHGASTNDEDDGMGDDDIENPMDHLFQCDWSEYPIHALELLLSQLEGQTEQSYLMKYNFPVGYDKSELKECIKDETSDNETNEAKLSRAQHASEILIGIIQNSPRDSSVIMALSTDPFLGSLIELTSFTSGSKENGRLVPYESIMTCSMTVLENLILQLGGYGSASYATTTEANTSHNVHSSPSVTKEADTSFCLTELGPHTPISSPSLSNIDQTVATYVALKQHLPSLLENLSSLLVHPETKNWEIVTQYTHNQPRPILGIVRLRIIRLLEALVLLGDPMTDLLLQQSICLEITLDLFWKFEWCSMLHQSVANFLVHVFEANDQRAGLQSYFIERCQLLKKLMDSFCVGTSPVDHLNDSQEVEANHVNQAELGDDAVMAMKTMYTNPATSSLESLDGSESDNSCKERFVNAEENDAVAHVSEDDVESAMEKEEQDNEAMVAIFENNSVSKHNFLMKTSAESETSAIVRDDRVSCRRGYMGHVIIICQSLVKASDVSLKGNSEQALRISTTECNESQLLDDDILIQNATVAADFESSAVHLMSNESPISSRKRIDTSPTRVGDGDVSTSPTPHIQVSPTDIERHIQSSLQRNEQNVSHLASIINQDPLAERWKLFISSTLPTELDVQSTPLGGQNLTKDSSASVGSDSKNRFASDTDTDFLGNKGVFGIIDGDFNMNEAEIDIAAEMMESLNLHSPNKDPQSIGHNRMSGTLLAGNNGSSNGHQRNIGNFGSLIQSTSSIESKGYVYDDPLGCVCQFDNENSSDEEDNDFAPKAANFSGEGNSDKVLNKSSSTDEEDEEDMAPVIDLFTGNFSENNFVDDDAPVKEESSDSNVGWANFADFDTFELDDTESLNVTAESPS